MAQIAFPFKVVRKVRRTISVDQKRKRFSCDSWCLLTARGAVAGISARNTVVPLQGCSEVTSASSPAQQSLIT
eukprot:2204393-Alexandrium_andersonii.AAC.1